jgi:hypothetical protein
MARRFGCDHDVAHLDLAAIASTPVQQDPFAYMLVSSALNPVRAKAILESFPVIQKPGSFALADLDVGAALRELISELEAEPFRRLLEEKFQVDLAGRVASFTLRGACAAKDGQIHTDSKSKILTVLIYLNADWTAEGGRLRLLHNGRDLEDFAEEIEPTFGKMLAFRRCERSWHGHHPYEGPRRVLQMNYLVSAKASLVNTVRHRFSALMK